MKFEKYFGRRTYLFIDMKEDVDVLFYKALAILRNYCLPRLTHMKSWKTIIEAHIKNRPDLMNSSPNVDSKHFKICRPLLTSFLTVGIYSL